MDTSKKGQPSGQRLLFFLRGLEVARGLTHFSRASAGGWGRCCFTSPASCPSSASRVKPENTHSGFSAGPLFHTCTAKVENKGAEKSTVFGDR